MSVQRRSFFALKCYQNYCAEIPPVPGLSLCGGAPFSLGAVFWYSHAADDNILFRQKDVFTFGVRNGSVYFNAKNLGSFYTDTSAEPALEEEEWNQAAIVYDGAMLSIYVQGLLVNQFAATGASYLEETTRCEMGIMDGYLQELTLYSRALTEDEVLHLQFTHPVSQQDTALWLDFDAYAPADQGCHSLPLQLKGRCDTVNLVYGFVPEQNGFALPFGAGQINPGGLPSGEMTLLAAVFPQNIGDSGAQDAVIFSNGETNGAQSIAMGLSRSTGTPYISLGKERFTFTSALKNYNWYQLAVTVKDTAVSLYIDGVSSGTGTLATPFVRTDPPSLMIGNQMHEGQTMCGFCGCIDMLAVFDCALSAEKLTAYADVAPYLFEEHLAALWLFSDQYPGELVTGGTLTYSSGIVGSTPQENTVLDHVLPAMQFAMPDAATGEDELHTWETRLSAEAFLQGMAALTGMTADGGFSDAEHTRLNGSVARIVSSTYDRSEVTSELYESGKFTKEDMQEILSMGALGGCVGALCYAFYCTAKNGGLRRAMMARRFLHYFRLSFQVSSWPEIGAVLTSGATLVEKYLEKNPAPDTDTFEDDDFSIAFRSIAFYHEGSEKAGALFALPDFGQKPVLPEWQTDGTGAKSAPALYHSNLPEDSQLSVLLAFHCELKSANPLTLSLCANCIGGEGLDDVLGPVGSATIAVDKSGDYTLALPLNAHKLKTAQQKAHNIRWHWVAATSGGESQMIRRTDHTIHVLAAAPLSPWTTEKDSYFPPVYPAIELCHRIASLACGETDINRRFASQFVAWSHGDSAPAAAPWADGAHFSTWGMDDNCILAFDSKGCFAAIKQGEAALGALDYACLQYLVTRLEGLEKLRILQLAPLYEDDSLVLRKHRRAGAQSDETTVLQDLYYVCGIPGSTQTAPPEIWDAFLTLYDAGNKVVTAAGLPFCQENPDMDMIPGVDNGRYRTLLCQAGGTCAVSLVVEWVFPEVLPPQHIVPGNPILGREKGRLDFDSSIREMFVVEPHPVRCHSLSYYSMENAIIQLVNNMQEMGQEAVYGAMQSIWRAVTLSDDFVEDDDDFHNVAIELINWLCEMGLSADSKTIAEKAEELMRAFNNCKENLRLGNSDWNSSVGKSFDPQSWGFILTRPEWDGRYFRTSKYLISENDNPRCNVKLEDGLYLGAEVKGTGFYLKEPSDAKRILELVQYKTSPGFSGLLSIKRTKLKAGDDNAISISDKRPSILCSSSNTWNLEEDEPLSNASSRVSYVYLLDQGENPPAWKQVWL